MPRRRIPRIPIPSRPDHRRLGGNGKDAQRPRRGRAGETERIAERRVRALELRKRGSSYRQIAQALAIDTHTAWADVAAELAAIREQTVEQAHELRALELERLDAMNVGLWPQIQAGSPPAVSAAVRVSERRARLAGLDAPVVTKSELSGSVGVYTEKLAAERELFLTLSIEQMEEIARDSQAMIDKMTAMAHRNASLMLAGVSPSPVVDVITDDPIEPAHD